MRKRYFKQINIKWIPQRDQRYKTDGDYWLDKDGIMQVRISTNGNQLKTDFYTYIIHELVEAFLTMERYIKWEDIDKFDMEFKGDDPGASKDAPYHKEHEFANKIEQLLLKELDGKKT